MTSQRTLLILLTIVATCGISCGPDLVEVLLECYSPDRKAVALVWAEAGGMMARDGELVGIQSIPQSFPEVPADPTPVLAVKSSASAFALKWEGNDRLLITISYPDRATVSQFADERIIHGHPVRIAYQEVKIDKPFMTTKAVCESGGKRIENPAPRRLK
jgi:hypothetical protein